MKAGTKMRVRLLLAGMHRQVADPVALAAKIRTDYGISTAPSYTVKAQVGRVVDQQYVLTLAAAPEGCFVGSVTGIASLPGNLGCAVQGLNDNWTAWYQLRGEKPKTRIVPVAEGAAYAVLRDEDEGRDVFIGHPVVADRPELILNVALSEDGKKWLLEVHNPTDQVVKSLVKSSPHVTGIRFEEANGISTGHVAPSRVVRTGEETSVAFRSAKAACFRGAKGDTPTVLTIDRTRSEETHLGAEV